MDQKRMEELRERRAQIGQARERERLRALYGEEFASAVAIAAGKPLSLADFDVNAREPLPIVWVGDLADAPGLVAAYIEKSEVARLLGCFRSRLGALNGMIGFHDKPYLGFAAVREVDPVCLLEIADKTEDSVVFHCDAPFGVLMVDCYTSQPCEPFSVIVQGDELVRQLEACFDAHS